MDDYRLTSSLALLDCYCSIHNYNSKNKTKQTFTLLSPLCIECNLCKHVKKVQVQAKNIFFLKKKTKKQTIKTGCFASVDK